MKYSAAMIVWLAVPLASAPPPRLIREIDLNQTVPARPDFEPFATFVFSPDEKWLAAAIGAHQTDHHKRDRNVDLGPSESLLLVPVNGTADQQVQVGLGLRPNGNPAWSPDSATVLVEGFANKPSFPPTDALAKLWDLRGNELLRRPAPGLTMGRIMEGPPGGIFGFLDSKHFLALRNPAKGVPDAFETLDLQGQVVDAWIVPKHWTVADISPERGLVAILTENAEKTLVIDNQSKKVILTRANPSGFERDSNASLYGRWQYFAESGKTLCSVGSVGTDYSRLDLPTECWDVDSGRKIAEFHRFPGGTPAAASSHGSRLVLTRDIAFPIRRGEAVVFPAAERVVWDFRSGAEIASWEVSKIAASVQVLDHATISSSGRYVAETAGALLRIYELP